MRNDHGCIKEKVIVYGKNVFWASVHHVMNVEVVVTWFGSRAKIAPQSSTFFGAW